MRESFNFQYIIFSQIDNVADQHPILFLKINERHNPLKFMADLKRLPTSYSDFPFYFYIHHNDKIVSSIKAFPDFMFIRNMQYKWAWSGDLFSDVEYRGKGGASILWKNMIDVLLEQKYIIGGAFMNPITTHIGLKTGFTVTDRAHRILFMKTIKPFLSAHSKFSRANIFVDYFYRKIIQQIKQIYLKYNSFSKSNYIIEKIEFSNKDKNDLIFKKIFHNNLHHFDDCAAKINWKVENRNGLSTFIIHDKSSHKPIAYYILKSRFIKHKLGGRYSNFNLMTLMDFGFFSSNSKNIDVLIYFVENSFWNSKSDILEIVTSNPNFIRKAYRKGFIKVGRGIEFMFKPPADVELHPDSNKIENWHFTHFISDGYSFL
jgi:hypothetical protein